MYRSGIIALVLSVIAISGCAETYKKGHFVSNYPPTADWVIFDTCTRNGSDCPGSNPLPDGEYKVVGSTFIFRQPVTGYVVAFSGKTYARGRVYTDPSRGGQAFEGVWVNKCEVRGRTGSSSTVFNLTRLDCLSREEQAKWVK